MPAAIDITGQKYGRLTAVRRIAARPISKWEFKCDCGAVVVALSGTVKSGKKHSCGCLRKECTAARKSKKLTGMRFSRLVVLEELKDRDKFGKVYWKCVCACGKETVAQTSSIIKGTKQSCGCLRREMTRALGKSGKQENPASSTREYKAAKRKKHRSTPEGVVSGRISRLLCWALVGVGAIKKSATFDLLGYPPSDLVCHLESLFTDGMCWENRKLWHIDHIVPLSSANSVADVVALNRLDNLRPLWAADNMRKGNRPA